MTQSSSSSQSEVIFQSYYNNQKMEELSSKVEQGPFLGGGGNYIKLFLKKKMAFLKSAHSAYSITKID